MRKILFAIAFIAVSITFNTACSGSDDNNFGSVSGIWRISKVIYTDENGAQQIVDSPFNNPDCQKSFFEFGENDALAFGTYNFECTVATDSGTWTQSGNLVHVEVPDINININDVWKIVQMDDTSMKVKVISADGEAMDSTVYLTFIKG